ncbi:hypothetical protein [Nostoc sp. CHAB 5715]|uniref:hypothetical protein n=1 Tax=Nostoc sp. CHAB 5715 TaxID=2780400 RepID=UPI001E6472D6|nr:hypothetical protein [Nostoc sp. CHAB 5715]MCC5626064.1 hypothetical protein [Nostoc sp. CHAB 5715]
MGIGHWALGIGHWALVINSCPSLPHSLTPSLPIPYSLFPIPLNGGREFYTSFGGDWFS